MSSRKENYQIQNNLKEISEEITNGKGWVLLPKLFDPEEIEIARQGIFEKKFEQKYAHCNMDDKHNNYFGLTWGLLSKGRVFANMATHPVILAVSRQILGAKCRLSSFAANTVLPGMEGQDPHLDYPYYHALWPATDECYEFPATNLLALQIVILLTDFNPENGSTALIPGSQRNPCYPENKEFFFENAQQVTAQAGDVLMFAGSIQHCAMPNKSTVARTGILQQMVPLFVTPFEDIRGNINETDENIRTILAMDHAHPIIKHGEPDEGQENYKEDQRETNIPILVNQLDKTKNEELER